jgi:hypothetical protein
VSSEFAKDIGRSTWEITAEGKAKAEDADSEKRHAKMCTDVHNFKGSENEPQGLFLVCSLAFFIFQLTCR